MSETKAWKDVCNKNGWEAVYMNSAEFVKFLDKTNEEYKAVLGEIGFLKK
jgi:putative tricarboxylic transport membrane protein